ncbi:hypothetical protein [uncultured Anaerococcus sp.]|uniref:hypothetical protein n=1 Tax=uncultured Anaerococcus sp. TaxID=293428 RepID=UPI00288B08BC|nr:hypothetical protein [uncultured Anaerococcus sp.]
MTKMDYRDDIREWQELLKFSMHEAIEAIWMECEEDLIERYKKVLATPDDEKRPSSFTMMQMTGLIGAVLAIKYEKDENELMRILKDSDAIFVKEIKNN